MARKESSPVRQKNSRALVRALLSAVQEWLLILMLFIAALYNYLITKYASYCKLQLPCPLCSRLDHLLGKEKPGYLWHMICVTHRLEISSLVACHAHNQLVDVHDMCENCLFSFATINKSNAETYRLLVGKLGGDPDNDSDEDPLLESPIVQDRKTKQCSCCNKPWTSKGYVQKLIHTRSFEKDGVEFDLPLPGSVGQDQDLEDRKEQSPVLVENTSDRNIQCDSLSHIGYKEVKIASDTESEISVSKDDNGDARALVRESSSPGIDVSVQFEQLGHGIRTLSDDLVTEKLLDTDPAPSLSHVGYKKIKITSDSESEVSMSNDDDLDARALVSETPSPGIELSVQFIKPDPNNITLAENSVTEKLLEQDPLSELSFSMPQMTANPHNDTATFFATAIGKCSEEFNQKQNGNNSSSFPPKELINLDGVPRLTDSELSADASNCIFTPVIDDLTPAQVTEENKDVSSDDLTSSSKAIELQSDVPESKRQTSPSEVVSRDATEDAGKVSKDQCPMIPDKDQPTCNDVSEALDRSGVKEVNSHTSVMVCENCRQGISPLDLGDAYKLAVGNRARQVSEMLAEQWLSKDSPTVSEELKLLVSQLSAARGLDQQINDMSPKRSVASDELKASAPSTSIGMQFLQKRISLERNESGLSVDGSIVSEIEGENEVDRLKRQVEHDMRTIKSLYKELEEERNASAIAANEAMAMITRLQEEKATIHMEALQNVRMMEEQAEFDIEAMQEANDLIAEREKEIQDLEAELELYRQKYPNESTFQNVTDPSCDMKPVDIGIDYSEPSHDEANIEFQRNSLSETPSNYHKAQEADLSLSDMLNNTVKILFLEEEASDILQNLEKLEKMLFLLSDRVIEPEPARVESTENELNQIHKSKEPDVEECSHISNGGESDYNGQDSSEPKLKCTDPLESEISSLNSRLKALEADRKFLSRFIYALKNEKEGLECIKEIATNLRELRKIGMRKCDQSA